VGGACDSAGAGCAIVNGWSMMVQGEGLIFIVRGM
jgi:hypothetical protein